MRASPRAERRTAMPDTIDSLILVLTAAVMTFLLRAIPFIVFSGGRQMPPRLRRVVGFLPAAIMGVLVIYCLKGDIISTQAMISSKETAGIGGVLATLAALLVVVGVHLKKRNTLLSIAAGTIVYMVLLRVLM